MGSDFIGSGWAFPLRTDATGGIALVEHDDAHAFARGVGEMVGSGGTSEPGTDDDDVGLGGKLSARPVARQRMTGAEPVRLVVDWQDDLAMRGHAGASEEPLEFGERRRRELAAAIELLELTPQRVIRGCPDIEALRNPASQISHVTDAERSLIAIGDEPLPLHQTAWPSARRSMGTTSAHWSGHRVPPRMMEGWRCGARVSKTQGNVRAGGVSGKGET